MLVKIAHEGQDAALARFGLRQAAVPPPLPGVGISRARPQASWTDMHHGIADLRTQNFTEYPSASMLGPGPTQPHPPPAPSSTVAPAASPMSKPSMMSQGRALGQQAGGAANRFMRSATRPLALMGIGALGASALSHGHQHDDGQLAYSPLPGSFIQ